MSPPRCPPVHLLTAPPPTLLPSLSACLFTCVRAPVRAGLGAVGAAPRGCSGVVCGLGVVCGHETGALCGLSRLRATV
jgi:hypothetical protein